MRDLGVVGDDSSGYLLLLVRLRPCSFTEASPAASDVMSTPLREAQSMSAPTALALALSFSFSLSVWFTGPEHVRLVSLLPQPLGSLTLGTDEAMGTGFNINRLESIVLLTGRDVGRPITLSVLDLAGRGRLRY